MELHTAVFRNAAENVVAEDIIPLCELAKNLEEAGEFESACETLRPFWRGLPHRPETADDEEDIDSGRAIAPRHTRRRSGDAQSPHIEGVIDNHEQCSDRAQGLDGNEIR